MKGNLKGLEKKFFGNMFQRNSALFGKVTHEDAINSETLTKLGLKLFCVLQRYL